MTVRRRREVETPAATDPLVNDVDQAQYETGQGPCLDAIHEQRIVRAPVLATDRRWPRFAERATAIGVRSMLSFRLYVLDGNLGALNLYALTPNAFDDESEHVGALFAAHAAIAMASAQREQNLVQAVSVRDLIGQAKGILMERAPAARGRPSAAPPRRRPADRAPRSGPARRRR
jgi:GAF domain-containing protein